MSQPRPGVVVWESPLGYRYLSTPDGSVLIGRPPPREQGWPRRLSDEDDEPLASAMGPGHAPA